MVRRMTFDVNIDRMHADERRIIVVGWNRLEFLRLNFIEVVFDTTATHTSIL